MQWKLFVFLPIVCVIQAVKWDEGCTMSGDIQYTRCLTPSPNVLNSGLKPGEKEKIVDYHNEMRSKAPASKMMKIYWNEDLAQIAQKWADQCPEDHDYLRARDVPVWVNPIGQNLGWGLPNYMELMKMWHVEKTTWENGEKDFEKIGHFTQMMLDFSTRIGCGSATCKDQVFHFVCNYAIGQPVRAYQKPYEEGKSCQSCPDTCVDNLCDCKDRMCFHYGTMDSNTCKCKCHPNFSGDLCEHKNCNATDGNRCKDIPAKQSVFYCNRYANIPVECPFMCGVCP